MAETQVQQRVNGSSFVPPPLAKPDINKDGRDSSGFSTMLQTLDSVLAEPAPQHATHDDNARGNQPAKTDAADDDQPAAAPAETAAPVPHKSGKSAKHDKHKDETDQTQNAASDDDKNKDDKPVTASESAKDDKPEVKDSAGDEAALLADTTPTDGDAKAKAPDPTLKPQQNPLLHTQTAASNARPKNAAPQEAVPQTDANSKPQAAEPTTPLVALTQAAAAAASPTKADTDTNPAPASLAPAPAPQSAQPQRASLTQLQTQTVDDTAPQAGSKNQGDVPAFAAALDKETVSRESATATTKAESSLLTQQPATPHNTAAAPVTPTAQAATLAANAPKPNDVALATNAAKPAENHFTIVDGGARPLNTYNSTAQLNGARSGNANGIRPGAIVEQVAVKLNQQAKSGLDQLTIQLRPADLGRIDIKLQFHDGAVSGTIVADQQSTLDMLAKDQRTLERALQDSGLRTDSGSLSFQLRDQSGQQAQQQSRGHGGGHSGNGNLQFDVVSAGETEASAASETIISAERVNLRV